ncbi:hypothetical protein BV898_04788 [Hypsibius exemplaris]|uniref:Chitin-binding type-2 domain-containing protein n=1 Tax=Hypsibius exemplaris TaxID=2072580 RepID=A0A1W0X1G4_HYPEX|nr:hypothetical protein BV898_04788 [Hypsibius exemplaris]
MMNGQLPPTPEEYTACYHNGIVPRSVSTFGFYQNHSDREQFGLQYYINRNRTTPSGTDGDGGGGSVSGGPLKDSEVQIDLVSKHPSGNAAAGASSSSKGKVKGKSFEGNAAAGASSTSNGKVKGKSFEGNAAAGASSSSKGKVKGNSFEGILLYKLRKTVAIFTGSVVYNFTSTPQGAAGLTPSTSAPPLPKTAPKSQSPLSSTSASGSPNFSYGSPSGSSQNPSQNSGSSTSSSVQNPVFSSEPSSSSSVSSSQNSGDGSPSEFALNSGSTLVFLPVNRADSSCVETLKKYPQPDVTFAPKHVGKNCPELCRNSTGHHSTGQFPHPWNCSLFINCKEDDAWVHFCQNGLQFNERNLQCDWPANAKCTAKPIPATQATTPTSRIVPQPIMPLLPQTSCREGDAPVKIIEDLGERADLCTNGTGLYPTPDCRFYVRCNNTRASVAKCVAGFVFDQAERRCDWPHKVAGCAQLCSITEDLVRETHVTPSPRSQIEVTKAPVSALPVIQATTTTTTTARPTTTTTTTTEAPHDPLCKNISGNFDYPNDCKKYVKCVNWHAELLDCPAGLVFVLEKGWCNWRWMLPEKHKCYQAFDNGTGDCPFTRDENGTEIAAPSTATTIAPSVAGPKMLSSGY